jgi:ATP-dependent helicase/nuclease subunit A
MSRRDSVPDPAVEAARLQRLAASPQLNVFVSANAGSGKTRVLVDRVVRLMLAGSDPDRVLCLTYTKAAANEMQGRLFKTLGDWAVAKNEPLAEELHRLNPEAPKPTEEQLRKARALFARALESPGGLKVQTIHAFCERLLRRFPLESGVEPGFAILDDVEAAAVADRARRRIAARAVGGGDLEAAFTTLAERLDDDKVDGLLDWAALRRVALAATLQEHKGVAGACAALAKALGIEADATPAGERVRAWAEAPRDELKLAMDGFAQGTGKTDASLAEALARALAAGDPQAAYDAYSDFLFTKDGELRASFGTKATVQAAPILGRLFGDSKGGYGDEAKRMEAARDRVRAAEILAVTRAGLAIADAYIAAYEAEKRRRHALDFADLVDAARRLLLDAEGAMWVRYKLDRGVDHVLVDEAQDTAPEQMDVIEALTEEFYAGAGASQIVRTTFVVGDEKQSIYSFQGADPVRFLDWSRRLSLRTRQSDAEFESIPFLTSFRCAPEVLKAVDTVFQLPEVEQRLFGVGGPPSGDRVSHRAARTLAPGLVEWWPLEPRGDAPEPPDAWSAPVDRQTLSDPRAALADRVARAVRDWIAAGEGVSDREAERKGERKLRPIRPRDVMILVRRRDAVFETVIRRLKFHGVPVAGADRMTLKAQLAVEDLLGAARAALLPEDDLAVAEFLKSPLVHPAHLSEPPIGEDALFDLAWDRGRTSLFRRLIDSTDPRVTEAAALMKDLVLRAEQEGPFAFLAGLLDRRSPTGESYARRLYQRLGPEAEDPIEELLARALAHERRAAPSLERFIHETLADSVEVKREGGASADVVRVMTVHGAKGLEAPVVILPDLGASRLGRQDSAPFLDGDLVAWSPFKSEDAPATRTLREARETAAEAERLRLLYVAMTRAEDRLIVCAPEAGRRRQGQTAPASDPMSWHGLVEAGLRAAGAEPFDTPVGAGLRLGAPARAEGAKPAKKAPSTKQPVLPVAPEWTAAAPTEPPARRIVSPARGLSPAARTPPALSPIATGGTSRFRRGRLVHRMLEFLPDLDRDRRRDAARRFLSSEGELDEAARETLLAETFAILDDPAFAPLFGPGSRGEVPLVGRSAHLPPGVVVNGRVDRLVITDDEVLIVDYKTDRPPPESPQGVDSLYFEQMAAYRALLRALYPGKRVRAALLWTDGPRLMALPESLLDAVLADA